MKKLLLTLTAFVCYAATFGQARIQIIHNASLAAIANVDVYLNDVQKVDDFQYRQATSFLPVTVTNNTVNLKVNGPTSTSSSDQNALNLNIPNLNDGDTLQFFITNTGNQVNLSIYNGIISSGNAAALLVSIIHGGDDAPAVDVVARVQGDFTNDVLLADSIAFTGTDINNGIDFAIVPAGTYVLDLYAAAAATPTKVKSYYAPISAAANGLGAVAFASGYLNPTGSQPAFGLFIALPFNLQNPSSDRATVIPLPEIKSSLVQAIHNSPEPLAATVDAYIINNLENTNFKERKIEDVAYKNATAFIPVEYIPGTGTDTVTLALAPGTSTSSSQAVLTRKYVLTPGVGYVLVAAGTLSPGFSPAKPLEVYVFPNARPTTVAGAGSGNIDVNVFHGATDAPEVQGSITAPAAAAGNLGSPIEFGEFSGYTLVPFQNAFYTAQVAATGATFESTPLPLGLNPQANGLAFTLYVTGFVNPSNNNNGQSLQVCAASVSGNPVAGVGLLCYDLVLLTSVEEKVVSKMLMFPNPAQNNLSVEYTLESAQTVKYNVYNTMGQLVIAGDAGTQSAGRNAINVNTSDLSTGQYVMQVLIGSEVNVTRTFIKE